MKFNLFKIGAAAIISLLLFASCEEKLTTEFGNSRIYFPTTSASVVFRDSTTVADYQSQPDTTVYVVGVYRSGVVDNLERQEVSVSVDSAYLQSIIDLAASTPVSQMTDLMTFYKNSKALGQYYCSVPSSVVINQGERRATVPVTIIKSRVKLYNNSYFNYSKTDFANSNILKDRILVIPIKITGTSGLPILESQQRCYLNITKSLIIK